MEQAMQRFSKFAFALLAVFAVTVAAVSSASAAGLPTANPTSTTSSTDAISLNAPKYILTNGNKIECTTATTGTATETKSPEAAGEFHITFRGCVGEVSGIKAKCTGLGDATEGEILTLGTYKSVYDTKGTELGVGILFEVASTHLTCAGLFLNIITGEQLCLVKEPYVAKTLHEMVCEQASGVQKETYANDAGTIITPKLVVTEGENAKPGAAEEAKALLLHLSGSKANVSTVYVMN
jgi:hypothetical protein